MSKTQAPVWMFTEPIVHTTSEWRSRSTKAKSSSVSDPCEKQDSRLQAEFESLNDVMSKPPAPLTMLILQTDSLCNLLEKGDCYVSKDGFNWKYVVSITIKPFSLSVNYSENDNEQYEIVFSFLYTTVLLAPASQQFPRVNVIRFFTKDKKFLDVRAIESKGDLLTWSSQCDLFWKVAYIKTELEFKKQETDKYKLCLSNLHQCCLDRYYMTAKLYWKLKCGGDKVRGGRMMLVKQDEVLESIFLVLFPYYISIQDDQKRKQVGFIILKFAYLSEEDDKKFSITTPYLKYTLQVMHETAKQEWIAALKKCMSAEKKTTQEEKVPDPSSPVQFKFKRLPYKMSLLVVGDSSKLFKLRSEGPWRIGRSRDNEITINEEECHVSRTHCEIEIIDNSPWIKDLNSASGTFLNGEVVTKSPLSPGDTIKIGNLSLKFEVKLVKHAKILKEKKKKNV